MDVECTSESVLQYTGDAIVVGFHRGAPFQGPIHDVDRALDGLLERLVQCGEIKGDQSEVTVVHTSGKLPSERVAVVGLGETWRDANYSLRRGAGAAARLLRNRGCRRIGLALHQVAPETISVDRAVRALTESVYLGLYPGEERKSSREVPEELETLSFLGLEAGRRESAEAAAAAGRIAGEETNYARRLVNLPPNDVTPRRLAQEALESAASCGLEVEILDPDRMAELGMGALLAVARGSDEPARFIVLRNKHQADEPRIAFVGKGVTFDSGGLSIKPADKMNSMKGDMAGGAAVLAAMRAVGRLDIKLGVIGLIPAAENLPSGRAYRPDDVITAVNGKTIEIVSTDAEGRLLLADALAYGRTLGATHIVDVATLTGACIIALGHVAAAVMGNDSAFVEAVVDAGERAGERLWRLPLFPEYRRQLDSKVADLKNVGGRPAGTITAGWFLREFIDDTAWAHIDIAGTAWSEKDEPHQIEGATGAGTRTLIALAQRMAGGGL